MLVQRMYGMCRRHLKPLSRTYFCLPAPMSGQNEQFHYFTSLVCASNQCTAQTQNCSLTYYMKSCSDTLFCLSSMTAALSHQCHPELKFNVAYSAIQVSWLLTLSGRPFQPPQQYDDPNLTCTNILSELREAGFAPASFPPTKLRQGYGDAVCSILNALCDLTLEFTNFSFQAPVYLAETYVLVLLPASCLNSTWPFSSLRKPAGVA